MEIVIFIITAFSFIAFFILFALTLQKSTKENHKNFNNATQNFNTELQSIIDDMTPREFYTYKMSQTKLIWDPRTQAYLRKWSKNDTTFH